MTTFAPGDVVVLKSWSPDMTIEWVGDHMGETWADVVWFAGREPSRDSFPIAALKPSKNKQLPGEVTLIEKGKNV